MTRPYTHLKEWTEVTRCKVGINFEKLAQRQNSEYCNADFWPVRRLGSSSSFQVLQRINLSESFRHYYIHHDDYVMKFEKNSVEPFQRYTEKR